MDNENVTPLEKRPVEAPPIQKRAALSGGAPLS